LSIAMLGTVLPPPLRAEVSPLAY